MQRELQAPEGCINWGGPGPGKRNATAGLLLFVLLLAASPLMAAPRAQNELLALAARQPEAQVSVIVQKAPGDDDVEGLVRQLGGQVTRDLHIVHAFAAQTRADDAVRLAQMQGVRWVSLDGPMIKSGGPDGSVSTSALLNVYNRAVRADAAWAEGYQGSTVTVAVVDSGIALHNDLKGDPSTGWNGRVAASTSGYSDGYGHGTHVAGIIGGNGTMSGGAYIGMAPKVQLVDVSVTDSLGSATESSVVAGLQWIYDHRVDYNIRVVNLSMNATTAQSYNTSALDAALEVLWFNQIVVVVSAGNAGNGAIYPPANDPFVITVGATDDKGTAGIGDDAVASFSAYGTTTDGVSKPDLVAPGKNIVSLLAKSKDVLDKQHPKAEVGSYYFKMSGTSMAAPVVAGAAALLLESEPALTPDQVKYRLTATANKSWAGYNAAKAGAGYLDVYAALHGATTQAANAGVRASQLLWSGGSALVWDNVQWGSVQWGSVQWGSVQWGSDYWGK